MIATKASLDVSAEMLCSRLAAGVTLKVEQDPDNPATVSIVEEESGTALVRNVPKERKDEVKDHLERGYATLQDWAIKVRDPFFSMQPDRFERVAALFMEQITQGVLVKEALVSDSSEGTGPFAGLGQGGTGEVRVIEPDTGELAVQMKEAEGGYHTIRENMNAEQVRELLASMGLKIGQVQLRDVNPQMPGVNLDGEPDARSLDEAMDEAHKKDGGDSPFRNASRPAKTGAEDVGYIPDAEEGHDEQSHGNSNSDGGSSRGIPKEDDDDEGDHEYRGEHLYY